MRKGQQKIIEQLRSERLPISDETIHDMAECTDTLEKLNAYSMILHEFPDASVPDMQEWCRTTDLFPTRYTAMHSSPGRTSFHELLRFCRTLYNTRTYANSMTRDSLLRLRAAGISEETVKKISDMFKDTAEGRKAIQRDRDYIAGINLRKKDTCYYGEYEGDIEYTLSNLAESGMQDDKLYDLACRFITYEKTRADNADICYPSLAEIVRHDEGVDTDTISKHIEYFLSSAYDDLKARFDSIFDSKKNLVWTALPDEDKEALVKAAVKTEKTLIVNNTSTKVISYKKQSDRFYLVFRSGYQAYIKGSGEISLMSQSATETCLAFFNDGGALYFRQYPGDKRKKGKPLTITHLIYLYNDFSTCSTDVFKTLFSKGQGLALYDIYKEIASGQDTIPPLRYEQCIGLHTKQEITRLYKTSFPGNFNKHPLSAYYMVKTTAPRFRKEDREKLYEYFRQGMFDGHCGDLPITGFGKTEKYTARILMVVNGIRQTDANEESVIFDFVCQEKRLGHKLKLRRSFRKMLDDHVRQIQEEAERRKNNTKVKIPEDTKFAKLRELLPKEFEWITDSTRLVEEGVVMHHCVASYDQKISQDKCAIYSLVYRHDGSLYDEKRYTIEFGIKDGRYSVVQIQSKFDRGCPDEVRNYVRSFIKE